MTEKKTSPDTDASLDSQKGAPRRRSYQRPALTEYGAVGKLTRNNATGSFVDGGGMRMAMSCL